MFSRLAYQFGREIVYDATWFSPVFVLKSLAKVMLEGTKKNNFHACVIIAKKRIVVWFQYAFCRNVSTNDHRVECLGLAIQLVTFLCCGNILTLDWWPIYEPSGLLVIVAPVVFPICRWKLGVDPIH